MRRDKSEVGMMLNTMGSKKWKDLDEPLEGHGHEQYWHVFIPLEKTN